MVCVIYIHTNVLGFIYHNFSAIGPCSLLVITHTENGYKISIYHKPAITRQYLNFNSHHPYIIKCLQHHAKSYNPNIPTALKVFFWVTIILQTLSSAGTNRRLKEEDWKIVIVSLMSTDCWKGFSYVIHTTSKQYLETVQPSREISAKSSLTQRRTWPRTVCMLFIAVMAKNTKKKPAAILK